MKEVTEILRLLAKAIEQNTINTYQEQGNDAADVVFRILEDAEKRIDALDHQTEKDCITEFITDTGDVYIDDEVTAQKMFDKGYRKQGDVVREIFDELKAMPKKFTEKSQDFEFGYRIAIQEILTELKKKYAEESGNDEK